MSNDITDKWTEIKTLIESIDLDVHKNAAGNVSAGVRARKGLRLLKNQAQSKNAQLIIITHDQRLKDQFKNSISL